MVVISYTHEAGFAYTVASGKLFCPFDEFHQRAEELLGRPIFTHEFASRDLWTEMRDAFEMAAIEAIDAQSS